MSRRSYFFIAVLLAALIPITCLIVAACSPSALNLDEQAYVQAVESDATLNPHNVLNGGYEVCHQVRSIDTYGVAQLDPVIVTALLENPNLDPALRYLCPQDAAIVSSWR